MPVDTSASANGIYAITARAAVSRSAGGAKDFPPAANTDTKFLTGLALCST